MTEINIKQLTDKEEFLKTEVGKELIHMLWTWDCSIRGEIGSEFGFERHKHYHRSEIMCSSQWEVYWTILKWLFGEEYHFFRTDEYFGICTDGGEYLYRHDREEVNDA